MYNTTVIGVDWRWLGLPAGLVLMTLVFVFAAAVQTAGIAGKHKLVGDSMLMHGVSGRAVDWRTEGLVPEGQEDVDFVTEEVLVRMRDTDDGGA